MVLLFPGSILGLLALDRLGMRFWLHCNFCIRRDCQHDLLVWVFTGCQKVFSEKIELTAHVAFSPRTRAIPDCRSQAITLTTRISYDLREGETMAPRPWLANSSSNTFAAAPISGVCQWTCGAIAEERQIHQAIATLQKRQPRKCGDRPQ